MNHTQKLFADLMREWARTLYAEMEAGATLSDQTDAFDEYHDIVRTIGYDEDEATRVVAALVLAGTGDEPYARGVCDALAVSMPVPTAPPETWSAAGTAIKALREEQASYGIGERAASIPTRGVPWTQPARDALDRAALPEALRHVPQLVTHREGACRFEIVAGGAAYGCTVKTMVATAEVVCTLVAKALGTPAKLFDMQHPQPGGRSVYEATP